MHLSCTRPRHEHRATPLLSVEWIQASLFVPLDLPLVVAAIVTVIFIGAARRVKLLVGPLENCIRAEGRTAHGALVEVVEAALAHAEVATWHQHRVLRLGQAHGALSLKPA